MYESLFAGQMATEAPVAKVYPLAQIKDAVKHAFGEARGGKILVKCNEDTEALMANGHAVHYICRPVMRGAIGGAWGYLPRGRGHLQDTVWLQPA